MFERENPFGETHISLLRKKRSTQYAQVNGPMSAAVGLSLTENDFASIPGAIRQSFSVTSYTAINMLEFNKKCAMLGYLHSTGPQQKLN